MSFFQTWRIVFHKNINVLTCFKGCEDPQLGSGRWRKVRGMWLVKFYLVNGCCISVYVGVNTRVPVRTGAWHLMYNPFLSCQLVDQERWVILTVCHHCFDTHCWWVIGWATGLLKNLLQSTYHEGSVESLEERTNHTHTKAESSSNTVEKVAAVMILQENHQRRLLLVWCYCRVLTATPVAPATADTYNVVYVDASKVGSLCLSFSADAVNVANISILIPSDLFQINICYDVII